MKNLGSSDTIVAISTALGEAGIGIVRLSGRNAIKIADRVFISKDGRKPSDFQSHTIHYGWIVRNAETIDETLLTVMHKPRTYTKEDIVEINCHGGIVVMRTILELLIEKGCRLANPGEFTKRAFLNGRIDLNQAEAVLDIIKAKTDSALKRGLEQLKGGLSIKIEKARKVLLDILSIIEANINFPEEEIDKANSKRISERLEDLKIEFDNMLDDSKRARLLREGVQVVICGKPNAGKSSLLNAIIRQERSIVTAVAGTTRDTIEEIIDIKGVPIKIVDTAGIIEPQDLIEKKAVQRSKRYIDSADLVLLLFDASRRLSREDLFMINRLRKRTVIAVINKIDLKQVINKKEILKRFKYIVDISAKKSKNIDVLENAIIDLVYEGKTSSSESILAANVRHIDLLRQADGFIKRAISSLKDNLSLEFIAQDIKEAISGLDEISGRRFSEELLDKIFLEFCIGK